MPSSSGAPKEQRLALPPTNAPPVHMTTAAVPPFYGYHGHYIPQPMCQPCGCPIMWINRRPFYLAIDELNKGEGVIRAEQQFRAHDDHHHIVFVRTKAQAGGLTLMVIMPVSLPASVTNALGPSQGPLVLSHVFSKLKEHQRDQPTSGASAEVQWFLEEMCSHVADTTTGGVEISLE